MKHNKEKQTKEINLDQFIDVKGWKALGNKLIDQKITGVKELSSKKKSQ